MAKFHVNAQGEAGPCSARQGKCPFGGDEHHYPTREIAQQAFELSMASSAPLLTIKRDNPLQREPRSVNPKLKTWREIGGQILDDYGRDATANSYGLDGEEYLDLEDIRMGVTLPTSRREAAQFRKYMTDREANDITGLKKEVTAQTLARLQEEPNSANWQNRTRLIENLEKLVWFEKTAAKGLEDAEKASNYGRTRSQKARGLIGRSRSRVAASVHREDIIRLKDRLANGSFDELVASPVREPLRIKAADIDQFESSPAGSVMHSLQMGGVLSNKLKESIYDRSETGWKERATGKELDSEQLQKEIFVAPDNSKNPAVVTLYATR